MRKRKKKGNMGGERSESPGVSTWRGTSGLEFQTTGTTSTLNKNKKHHFLSLSLSCHVRVL